MNMNKKQFINGCQGVLSSNAFSTEISYLECHAIINELHTFSFS